MWLWKVKWQTWCYISTSSRPMASKLGKVVNYYEKRLPIKSDKPLNTGSCEVKTNWKHSYCGTMPIPITPGKAITHNEELASIKSKDPLITWSFKVMWQIKSLICPLTHWSQSPNLAGWLHATWYISTTTVTIECWIIIRGTKSHTIVCHVRSQNQLNTLYSYYNKPLAIKLGM